MWQHREPDDIKTAGVSEHTGFPNAGTDSSLSSLDLARLLIQNPSSTYFMRVRGHAWDERGIFDDDVLVIDRALQARATDLVVFWDEDAFAIGRPHQVPEDTEVWGVVTTVIHQYRRRS